MRRRLPSEPGGRSRRPSTARQDSTPCIETSIQSLHVVSSATSKSTASPRSTRVEPLSTRTCALAGLMAADTPPEWSSDPSLALETEMVAQELTGAVQALANWWDEHRDVPRERVYQSIMDFAWIGLERLSDGTRWDAGAP